MSVYFLTITIELLYIVQQLCHRIVAIRIKVNVLATKFNHLQNVLNIIKVTTLTSLKLY